VIWAFAVTGILITRKKARRQIREERNLLEGLDAHPQQAAAAR
jgi:hypothetical protein